VTKTTYSEDSDIGEEHEEGDIIDIREEHHEEKIYEEELPVPIAMKRRKHTRIPKKINEVEEDQEYMLQSFGASELSDKLSSGNQKAVTSEKSRGLNILLVCCRLSEGINVFYGETVLYKLLQGIYDMALFHAISTKMRRSHSV
jgi:hypothetical protein